MAGVQFTGEAAKRIANVVRTVEAGPRGVQPVDWGMPRLEGVGGIVFRMATFTGHWEKDSLKLVTLVNKTTTPNSAVFAFNTFANLTPSTSCTDSSCAIARDGTQWYLIAAECC